MQVQPYLFFDGRCEEALDFYREKLGAEVIMMMRFKEMPASEGHAIAPGSEEKILHATFRIGDSLIMASDGMNGGQPKYEGFSLTLSVADDAEAERIFALISEDGQVQMPIGPTFWTSRFGMAADKFGVGWMVNVEQK
ncbi:MAG TPA: VOC family protein [Abditibacteriaceae bacterium]|jgi:PhnB protein